MKLSARVVSNSSGTPCFEVKYKDRPYRVKLFKFQEQSPDGTMIDCSVVEQANGQLYLRQDLPTLLYKFYKEGEEYEFEVRHDFTHNGYYELVDDKGIPFRLPMPKGLKLLTDSTVRCRIEKIDRSGAQLKLMQGETFREQTAPEEAPKEEETEKIDLNADSLALKVERDVFAENLPEWDVEELFALLFVNSEFYDRAVNSRVLDFIRQWSAEGATWDVISERLSQMLEAVMYVLEGSDILLSEEILRRKSLQQRLTVMIDNISGYLEASDALADGTHVSKIDRALASLRTSGYIYQAEKQLAMMMRIFSLSPDTMRDKMANILEIIHARNELFWRDEPFRKAFIRVLQLYCDQCSQNMEEAGTGNEAAVRSLIEALGIQLLLADRVKDAGMIDYNLNLASIYRYASLLKTSEPANAVRNAFLALMDVTSLPANTYQWGDTGAHDLMASRLTMDPVPFEGDFEKWYTNRQVVAAFNNEGLTITRTDVSENSLRLLELKDVGVWKNLKIRTTQQISQPANSSDLTRAKTMWNAIENSLFSDDVNIRRPLSKRKATPEEGDYVYIRVINRYPDGSFQVEVTDDEYEGRGRLVPEEIVKYKLPNLDVYHFCDREGNPYVFEARVKSTKGKEMEFSVIDELVEFSHDCIDNSRQMRCIIKSANQFGYVGISELGDSVRFPPENSGNESLRTGDVVIGTWWKTPDKPGVPYINGAIIGHDTSGRGFDSERAFQKLLTDYCGGEVHIEELSELAAISSDTAGGEDFLSDGRLNELLSILERKAAAESDYMKAYHHIGLARLLARIGRNERRREFYEAWMRLISILHHFAINGEVDGKQLAEFENNDRSRFDPDSELYRRYLQLKIVSYKGRPQMRDEIWRHMADEDKDTRQLAENIMAYNLIAETASMSALGEITDRINNILKVQGKKSTLHSFGSENKTTEFKTSLIFPPNNHMRPDPDAQSLEIMKELCALLNAEGGKLYLGVNDFGMGVGIESDLADKKFGFSEDKYDLYFHQRVCELLGRDIDAYVDGRFETHGGKRIYIVTIKPYYAEPVKVEGKIYERHGSSKLRFDNPKDIRLFTERRAAERDRLRAEAELKRAEAEAKRVEPVKKEVAPEPKPVEKQSEPVQDTYNPEKITTRHDRKVCPPSFDETAHDPATERYLQFTEDDFILVPEFYGYNEDDGLLLSLPIRDEDKLSWLVLGYEDGTVGKIPMRLVLDKEDYTPGKRYTDAKLIFTDILTDEDALLTLSKGKFTTWNARADKVENLPELTSLRNGGSKILTPNQEEFHFDVLSGPKQLNYQDLFDRKQKDAGKPFRPIRTDNLFKQLNRDGFMN